MNHKIVCCNGPISFFAASVLFSIYIVVINSLHISSACFYVFGKQKRASTQQFILVNLVTLVVCSFLLAAGILLLIGSLWRVRCIMKSTSPVFLILVVVRLALSVVTFLNNTHLTRLVGDISSGIVEVYASYVFWCLYKESKLRRSTAGTQPKSSVHEVEVENKIAM